MSYNAELILIVDESGSMSPQRAQTIASINELVQEQKRQPGDLAITLVTFNGEMRPRRTRVPSDQFEHLTPSDYEPFGSTALYDAICGTLDVAEQWPVPADTDRIVVIVTDGGNNASIRSKEDAKARIDKLTAQGWKFHYVGSGFDAMQEGMGLGVQSRAQVDLTNAIGTQSAYRSISATVTSLRAQP